MRERFPCTIDEDCNNEMASFANLGRGLQEAPQQAENALIEAGYDDFVVATERGSFHWQTVEHARAEAAEEGG